MNCTSRRNSANSESTGCPPTYTGAEIDIVEERAGALYAYECKWSRASGRAPASFLDAYPGASYEVVNRDTSWDYVGA